ncbi:MAG: hypothetical protein NC900_03275 [Candidatus Omnitrophica bacterium]|nr:hypothetical protein [Candidatus Omnitrophota bacterium]MCM8799739.1 hypothetical protein [Candidatus Omnitrophota bacterium]
MYKKLLLWIIIFMWIGVCLAEDSLVIDDFENPIFGGPEGTIDFGSGNGSEVKVIATEEIKYSGKQAIKVDFKAKEGGYMWVARGFDLDASNSQWLVNPQDINWPDYYAISFYMYGTDSKADVVLDIKDKGSEMWRFLFKDDFSGWKRIICPFDKFFSRTDWQPDSSDRNGILDFPLKSYQFEILPSAEGTLYFDKVELVKK